MQYLLLIYDDESIWEGWDEATQEQFIARYDQLVSSLQEQGVFIAGERLHGVDSATSVRKRNNQILVSDGPFAETREQLGGFFLVECQNLDHATRVAAQIPTAEVGTIEVRPLWSEPEP